MANNSHKIKIFTGTPSEVERKFNAWTADDNHVYVTVTISRNDDKTVIRLVYYEQEKRGDRYFY